MYLLRNMNYYIREVIYKGLTYLEKEALCNIVDQIIRLEKRHISGIFIEAGCALGGSAIVISKAKKCKRPFYIYDVFGMIPPPSEKDGEDVLKRYEVIKSGKSAGLRGNSYYGYENDLLIKVKNTFKNFKVDVDKSNIQFITGLFQDTLVVNTPVAFAHIDSDWYQSVFTCLNRIEPFLVIGGVIVIDDYNAWSGCRRAVDEYFQDKMDSFTFIQKPRLNIIREK
jgi:asparagine synthase (glutamine-hydrolysing)